MPTKFAKNELLEKSDEQLRDELLNRLLSHRLEGATQQVMNTSDPTRLPYRELPHGSAGNLYLLYLAQCRAEHQEEASRSTFYKAWKKWKTCMTFHKKSAHSLCLQCSEMRAAIRAAKDFQEHARLSQNLFHHYTSQYKDRQVYYLARERSCLKKDLICINVDSFDKSKIALPKYPFGRVMRALEYVFRKCRSQGTPFPHENLGLWLQSDNTVKEIRNGIAGRLCAALVQVGMPRQGHDIDKDERLPRRLRCEDYDSRRLDVFALIKQTMAEQALSQNALLVLPQTLLSETEAFLNSVIFPNNGQLCIVIQEFLKTGYCPTFDAIRVKFPYADETRELRDWTTGVVDGQTRVLACFAIVGFCAELELDDLQMMEIQDVLSSLKLLRCLPLEVLALDFWVPSVSSRWELPRFASVKVFREILATTEESAVAYIKRACLDFEKATGQASSAKTRKFAMLTEEQHFMLHDVCCLWTWLLRKLTSEFTGEVVTKVTDMFYRGTMEEYVSQNQDRARNAHNKSVECAFQAWTEQLRADQGLFESIKLKSEKEGGRMRQKLVKNLEDCHNRAWSCIKDFIENSMMTFPGRQSDADSTMMPAARSWIRNCLEEECISPEDHSVVLWLNCTTIGIIPTLKYDFFLTFLSNVLTDFSKNGVCFIVFPNRASKCKTKKEELDPDSTGDMKEEPKLEDGESENEDVDAEGVQEEEAELRDVIYRNCLREAGRLCAWIGGDFERPWEPFQVYKRQALVEECSCLIWVAGGTDILKKSMASFCIPTSKLSMMIDMHAYDGWPAMFCLEELGESRRALCASLCFDNSGTELVSRISHRLYEGCREENMKVNGFPDFNAHIQALKDSTMQYKEDATYKVCQQQHDKLLLLQSFAKKWVESEITMERAKAIVEDHNERFNPGSDADYWAPDETATKNVTAEDASERPQKRIKIDHTNTVSTDELAKLKKPRLGIS
ncbi:Uncharacterized protein SCF082_LOCUS15362 [Durusdinium trenchii]|uniref:Uncharacterized protein n=1 Tax=Durusdinium trenchii TaxID=1381693 RepID=A0ABP0K5A1_9DINO